MNKGYPKAKIDIFFHQSNLWNKKPILAKAKPISNKKIVLTDQNLQESRAGTTPKGVLEGFLKRG